jgi:hypothetical protein
LKHTGLGVVLNAGAMLMWSLIQDLFFGKWAKKGNVARDVVAGSATAALAYITDYKVVPQRLTPGFEMRLSNRALGAVYIALAASLAAGLILRKNDHL